jgi:hypothetical protein
MGNDPVVRGVSHGLKIFFGPTVVLLVAIVVGLIAGSFAVAGLVFAIGMLVWVAYVVRLVKRGARAVSRLADESDVTPRDNTLGRAFPDGEAPPTIDEWLDRDLDDLDPADSDRTPRRPRDFRPGDGRPTPS